MQKQKGSDLHLAAHSNPMIRINGDLVKIDVPPLGQEDILKIFAQVLSPELQKQLEHERSCDFAFSVPNVGVFRGNIFWQRFGLSGVFRALPENPPTMEQLKLPQICKAACSFPTGLVTGPTGSGKSTTLAAMINHINLNERSHILTLEDPVEFRHESKRCMVSQRQLGEHFTSFASALKAALREDPDVILVGEMRDPETIALAITAAETGHLVFGTLHTNTAHKTVDRIIDSFPADQQNQIRTMLSESLRAVISQKLVPTADHKGRIGIHDVLVVSHAVSALIRDGKTFQIPSVMQTSKKEGMQIMDQILLQNVSSGVVSGPDAWSYSNDKSLFAQWAPPDMPGSGQTTATAQAKTGGLAGAVKKAS
jgi:twitching motility protein PilT